MFIYINRIKTNETLCYVRPTDQLLFQTRFLSFSGGKWSIHGNKHRRGNPLHSLELLCKKEFYCCIQVIYLPIISTVALMGTLTIARFSDARNVIQGDLCFKQECKENHTLLRKY